MKTIQEIALFLIEPVARLAPILLLVWLIG